MGGVKYLLTNASFKITFWFRIGSYLRTKNNILYKILYALVAIIYKHNQYITGIQLPLGTKVGQGLSFSHFSCIVINNSAQIGNNCTIFQGVTIGGVRGPKGGVPTIGNNVVLSSGAKIIGNICIGNNVIVGAGAVVVDNLPDNAVAVGIPAKVISYNGKDNTQYYLKNQWN
jgi:serine O-acetyltransferase